MKPLTLSTTLSQLHAAVCQHLAVPIRDEPLQQPDCNCGAAQQIDLNAALNKRGADGSDALHALVVVYEDNKVAVIHTREPTLASIQRAARDQLQDKAAGKLICAIGGVKDGNVRDGSDVRYLKIPVLAVCSHQSHRQTNEWNKSKAEHEAESDASLDDRGLTLDLHTSECPVDITAHNKGITIADAGLHDCAIDGVLTILAVQRVFSTNLTNGTGKLISLYLSELLVARVNINSHRKWQCWQGCDFPETACMGTSSRPICCRHYASSRT